MEVIVIVVVVVVASAEVVHCCPSRRHLIRIAARVLAGVVLYRLPNVVMVTYTRLLQAISFSV